MTQGQFENAFATILDIYITEASDENIAAIFGARGIDRSKFLKALVIAASLCGVD